MLNYQRVSFLESSCLQMCHGCRFTSGSGAARAARARGLAAIAGRLKIKLHWVEPTAIFDGRNAVYIYNIFTVCIYIYYIISYMYII